MICPDILKGMSVVRYNRRGVFVALLNNSEYGHNTVVIVLEGDGRLVHWDYANVVFETPTTEGPYR